MKVIAERFIAVVAIVLASSAQSFAVEGQTLQVQGTNLVLSWPSHGYEHYLIQYRPTLDPSTPWANLTNNYPANSTNRTTFTIYGVVPPPAQGGGGGGGGSGGPPSPTGASQQGAEEGAPAQVEPLVMRADGSSPPFPLLLYPPGFDLSGFLIYDPLVSDWVDGSKYSRPDVSPVNLAGGQANGAQAAGWDQLAQNSGFFRVFHIPDFAFNVTNYTYDGPTFLPVDYADYVDRVDSSEVFLNGEVSPYAVFTPYVSGGQTNWGVGIYFDRIPSGTYQIQLHSTVRLSDDIGEDTAYVVLSNRMATILVNNQVTFTNWDDAIQGDSYTFRARTANTNTDWSIDIYDAWDEYVNGASGHTTNGEIAWTWDLRDISGNRRDDLDNDPYLASYITFNSFGSGALAATTVQQPQATPYPNRGEWMISFQDRWFSDAPAYPADSQDFYDNGMDGVFGGPLLVGDAPRFWPLAFGTNVYTQAQRNASWAGMKAWLGDPHVRNWYYYGHGAGSEIGCDMQILTTNGTIVSGGLTSAGSKSKLLSWEVWNAVKANRYRFVFLDGCNTALGNWPATFNISKQTNNLAFYQNHPNRPRPSAFVGWGTSPGGEGWGSIEKYFAFRANWMGLWANTFGGKSLTDALIEANTLTPWIGEQKFRDAIRVYGYTVMHLQDYNRKNNWP